MCIRDSHGVCARILRRFAPRLGLPHAFTLLDASDAADVLDVMRTQAGHDRSATRFPRKGLLQSVVSAARNTGRDPADVLAERAPHLARHADAVADLARAYAVYKRDHALVDYDDLLLETLRLFREHDDVRETVASGMQHVLVDEYQDVNAAQVALVEAFVSVHGNVTAVGDDAQSIYAFRGASVDGIFAFPERFPGTRTVALTENYRSVQPVLDLANAVQRLAARRYDKRLTATKDGGERPAVVAAADERTESRFVAQAVLQLREAGTPLSRMAVLFRSAFHSFDLEVELGRRSIPFVKFGGLKLAEAAHVKDVLAYLKVADNPRDAPAWMRLLKLLPGIGAKTALALTAWITSETDVPFAVPENAPRLRRHAHGVEALLGMVRRLRTDVEAPLGAQMDAVLAGYAPLLKDAYPDDAPRRQQDLDHLAGLAASYPSRRALLEALALDPVELSALDATNVPDDEAPLVLSTVHSAKGLEFDTVFVIHLLDGYLPSQHGLGSQDEIDEEVRLLYVAVTRAERNLFLSYPATQHRRRAGDVFARPSRFLARLTADVLEPMALVETPVPAPTLPAPAAPTRVRRRLAPVSPPSPGPDADAALPF